MLLCSKVDCIGTVTKRPPTIFVLYCGTFMMEFYYIFKRKFIYSKKIKTMRNIKMINEFETIKIETNYKCELKLKLKENKKDRHKKFHNIKMFKIG